MNDIRRAVESIAPAQARRIIAACAIGTMCEWYDFFLYATLAPFFASLFFPGGNRAAALISTFATYAAGFLVRPIGGLLFGRIGDRIGRKYTVLVNVMLMGAATFCVGCLPSYDAIGTAAPVILVGLRMLQGLALGGEYGGTAIYVAEFFPRGSRTFATAFVQTTATLGLMLSLLVVILLRQWMSVPDFTAYGWRIPFLFSAPLFAVSFLLRRRLPETPEFVRLEADEAISGTPMADALLRRANFGRVMLALFGACAGQGVVWYCGQYYALLFLTGTLHLSELNVYLLLGGALLAVLPLFLIVGYLADTYGRLRFIVAGCALAAIFYMPLFHALARAVNPDLIEWQQTHTVTLTAEDCHFHVFVGPWSEFTPCDQAKAFLASHGISFNTVAAEPGNILTLQIDDQTLIGFQPASIDVALERTGFHPSADPAKVDGVQAFAVMFALGFLVTLVYGPIAAFLVGLFPTSCRYTSVSLPYHLGNGLFGGVLPLMSVALVTYYGDIFAGLYYPIGVAAMSAVVGAFFLRKRRVKGTN